ncbi:uncharacterized protein si:dkey-229e3.2 isoform X1 [Megalops cyprinoides]|uniref:uncharacterized protein si:dkey-229e3.2 isoform X1 n=2 Tax=Megalops cyprinoides TaxID=118141 RepID=UPI001863FBFB|nr:uncharacterized protein si:dkey-229e3.2 isoform X1 [Megalops cyprinoides]
MYYHHMKMNESGIFNCYEGNLISKTGNNSWDVEDWSAQSPQTTSNANLDSSFGEWNAFEEDHRLCTSPAFIFQKHSTKMETSQHSTRAQEKVPEWPRPLQVFHDYFPVVNTSEDSATTDARPLSQMLEKMSETLTSSSPVICDAAALWRCLLKEPSGLRLAEPSPCPHSLQCLLSALRIAPENVDLHQQTAPPAETDPEEASGEPASPPARPLIQTKLLAPPWCQDGPSFLYQVSIQWLSQHNLHLQRHSPKKEKGLFF